MRSTRWPARRRSSSSEPTACPWLLLPVRLECRFTVVDDRSELQVRIYPDEIAVHTHEEALTGDELESGRTFWREVTAAREQTDPAEVRRLELGAWRILAGRSGSWRAAWIARRTEPAVTDLDGADPAELPDETWTRFAALLRHAGPVRRDDVQRRSAQPRGGRCADP